MSVFSITESDVLKMVAETQFLPFDKSNYMLYSGVGSSNPMIGYVKDDFDNGIPGFTLIVDGDEVEVIDDNGDTVIVARLWQR
jgi:hypothetical protein